MKLVCVVPSAGKGKRLGLGEDKAFVKLCGKPLLLYTLKRLSSCPFINDIVVVVSGGKLEACKRLVKKYKLSKVNEIVCGGKTRFISVRNGLAKVKNADFVLIHDGVRPFVNRALIKKCLLQAKKFGASLLAIPSKQTLKLISRDLFTVKTPKRDVIWEAQTPQVFRADLIRRAYKKARESSSATDDASLVEKLGHKVKVVKDSYRNIKITTREDLELAKILLRKL